MAPAPTLTDYLAGRTTPETGAVIIGLSAAAAETAARLAGFASGPALETEADDAAFAARLAPLGVRFLASRPQGGVSAISRMSAIATTCSSASNDSPFSPPVGAAPWTPGLVSRGRVKVSAACICATDRAAASGDAMETIWFMAWFLDRPGAVAARKVGRPQTWDGRGPGATEFGSCRLEKNSTDREPFRRAQASPRHAAAVRLSQRSMRRAAALGATSDGVHR